MAIFTKVLISVSISSVELKVGTLYTACSHRGVEPHEGSEIVGTRKIMAWRHGGTAAQWHGEWMEDQNVYPAYKCPNDGVRATGGSGGYRRPFC